jgi:hypothetical protein
MLGLRRDTSGHETAAKSASVPNAFPQDQRVNPNLVSLWILTYPENGAGDGNRTHGEGAAEPLKQAVW